MFRDDGLPWWSTADDSKESNTLSKDSTPNASSAATASRVPAPATPSVGSTEASATAFALAAADCWVAGLAAAAADNTTTNNHDGTAAATARLEAACQTLLALSAPVTTTADAAGFVASLMGTFARIAPLHHLPTSASTSGGAVVDVVSTRVIQTLIKLLAGDDSEEESTSSSAYSPLAAILLINACGLPPAVHKREATVMRALAVCLGDLAASLKEAGAVMDVNNNNTANVNIKDAIEAFVQKVLSEEMEPTNYNFHKAAGTFAASYSSSSSASEEGGGGEKDAAGSEGGSTAAKKPSNGLSLGGRAVHGRFQRLVVNLRAVMDVWAEFIVTSSPSPSSSYVDAIVLGLYEVANAVSTLKKKASAVNMNLSSPLMAVMAEAFLLDPSSSVSSASPPPTCATLALGRLGRFKDSLPRIRKAVTAVLATATTNANTNTSDGFAIATSLTALVVQLGRLELALSGVDVSEEEEEDAKKDNGAPKVSASFHHQQPYAMDHPLRQFHAKALLLQQSTPLGVFGGFENGVDLLAKGTSMSSAMSPSSSASASSTATANTNLVASYINSGSAVSTSGITLGDHIRTVAANELTSLKRRKIMVTPSTASAPAASATSQSNSTSANNNNSTATQISTISHTFSPRACAASILWGSPVAAWASVFSAIAANHCGGVSSSSSKATTIATVPSATPAASSASSSSASSQQPLVPVNTSGLLAQAPSRGSMLHLAAVTDRHQGPARSQKPIAYDNMLGTSSSSSSSCPLHVAVTAANALVYYFALIDEIIKDADEGLKHLLYDSSSSPSSTEVKSADDNAAIITPTSTPTIAMIKRRSLLLAQSAAMDAALMCLGKYSNTSAIVLAMLSALENDAFMKALSSKPSASASTSSSLVFLKAFYGDLQRLKNEHLTLEGAADASSSSSSSWIRHLSSPAVRPFLSSVALPLVEQAILTRCEMGYVTFLLGPLAALGVLRTSVFGTLLPFAAASGALAPKPSAATTEATPTPAAAATARPTSPPVANASSASASTAASAAAAPPKPPAAATPSPSPSSASAFGGGGGGGGAKASVLPPEDGAHWVHIVSGLPSFSASLAAAVGAILESVTIPYFSRFLASGGGGESVASLNASTSAVSVPTTSAAATAATTATTGHAPLFASVATTQSEDALLFIRLHIDVFTRVAAECGVFLSQVKQRQINTEFIAPAIVDTAAEFFFSFLALVASPAVDLSHPEVPSFSPNQHKLFVLRSLESAIEQRCLEVGASAAAAAGPTATAAGSGGGGGGRYRYNRNHNKEQANANGKNAADAPPPSHNFMLWGFMAACEWKVLCLGSSPEQGTAASSFGLRREASVPLPTALMKRAIAMVPTAFATDPLTLIELYATSTVDVTLLGEWRHAVVAFNNSKGKSAPAALSLATRQVWGEVQAKQEARAREHLSRWGVPSAQSVSQTLPITAATTSSSSPSSSSENQFVTDVWRTIKTTYIHTNPLVGVSAIDNCFKALLLKASMSVHDAVGAANILVGLLSFGGYDALKTFAVEAEEEENRRIDAILAEHKAKQEQEEAAVKAEVATAKIEDDNTTAAPSAVSAVTVQDEAKKEKEAEEVSEAKKEEAEANDNATATPPPPPLPSPSFAAANAVKAAVSSTPIYVQVQRRLMATLFAPLTAMLAHATAVEAEALATFAAIVTTRVLIPWCNQACPAAAPAPPATSSAPNSSTAPIPTPHALSACAKDALFPMLPLVGADTSDECMEKVLKDLATTITDHYLNVRGVATTAQLPTPANALATAAIPIPPTTAAAVNAFIVKSTCRRLLGVMRFHKRLLMLAEENLTKGAAASTSTSTAPSSSSSSSDAVLKIQSYAQHMGAIAANLKASVDLPPPAGRTEPFIEVRDMMPVPRIVRLRHLTAAANTAAAAAVSSSSATTAKAGGGASSVTPSAVAKPSSASAAAGGGKAPLSGNNNTTTIVSNVSHIKGATRADPAPRGRTTTTTTTTTNTSRNAPLPSSSSNNQHTSSSTAAKDKDKDRDGTRKRSRSRTPPRSRSPLTGGNRRGGGGGRDRSRGRERDRGWSRSRDRSEWGGANARRGGGRSRSPYSADNDNKSSNSKNATRTADDRNNNAGKTTATSSRNNDSNAKKPVIDDKNAKQSTNSNTAATTSRRNDDRGGGSNSDRRDNHRSGHDNQKRDRSPDSRDRSPERDRRGGGHSNRRRY